MSKYMKKKTSSKAPVITRMPGNGRSVSSLISFYRQARIPKSGRLGICLVDGDSLRIVKSNRVIRSVFNRHKDDIEGRKVLELFYPSDRDRLISAFNECLDRDRVIELDEIFLKSDSARPARLKLNLQAVSHNGKSCIQVILKRHLIVAEVSLNGSGRFETGDAVALLSPLKLIDCNKKFLSLFGYKSLNRLDCRLTAFFSMESRRKIKARFDGSCKQGVPFELEGMHNSGDLLYFEAITEIIPCNRRTLLRLRLRDLTSHKKTEHELIRSKTRFRSLLENIHYGFFIIDLESKRIVYMNSYGRALLGKTKIQLEKLNPLQLLLPDRLPIIQEMFEKFTEGFLKEYRSEEELKLPDGRRIHIEYESHYIEYQGHACIQGIFHDISSRVEAKRALQENEERFRQMAENIREIFWIVERNPTRTIYVSPVYEEIVGLPLEDVYHDHDDYLKLVHPDDYEKVSARFDKADIETDTEYRIVRPDGAIRWLRSRSFPIYDHYGKVYRTAGIVRDITDRKLAEQALKASENKYRGLYENLTDGYAASDMKGNIVEFNRAFELMTGYSPEQLKNMHYNDLTPKKWQKMESQIMRGEVLMNGFSKVYEKEYRRRDGALVPVEMRAHLLRDADDNPIGYWAIIRDITDRKKTDERIRESEQKYRSVVDNVGIGISLISPEMRILSLNNQMKSWFPHIDETRHPLCYRQFQNPHRDKICPFCPTCKTFEDGARHESIAKAFTGRGQRSFRIVSSPIRDDSGKVTAAIEMVEDITERLKAEDEIRKFKTIADRAAYATGIADMQGKLIYANESLARMHGYKLEEILGKPISMLHTRKQLEWVRQVWDDVIETGSLTAIEVWRTRRNGEVFPTLMSLTMIRDKNNEPLYISASAIDITEIKQAEEALRDSEERYRAVVEDMPALVCRFRKVGRLTFVNQVFCQYYDVSPGEVIGNSFFDFIPRNNRNELFSRFKKLTRKSPVASFELEVPGKSESRRWQQWIMRALFDDNGKIQEIQAIGYDVTERKLAEKALRESEEQFRSLAQLSPDLIAIQAENEIVYINQAGAGMLGGQSPEDIIGKSLMDFVPDKQKKYISARIRDVIKDKKQFSYVEDRARRLDGKMIDIEVASLPLQFLGRPAIQIVARDISDKKRAERALRNQRDMLKAVTSEVIRVQEDERRRISMELHDSIGQALSLSKLQIQNILKKSREENGSFGRELNGVIRHISDTISDLRKISANLRPVILDNLGLIPSIEWYLKDFGHKVELEIDVDIKTDYLNLDPRHEAHVFRVIQEIMINIHKHAEANRIRFTCFVENGCAFFQISENGRGFDPANIFEVETRKQGMGLINIMERVELVRGKIEVDSRPGHGATYTVRIPLKK